MWTVKSLSPISKKLNFVQFLRGGDIWLNCENGQLSNVSALTWLKLVFVEPCIKKNADGFDTVDVPQMLTISLSPQSQFFS